MSVAGALGGTTAGLPFRIAALLLLAMFLTWPQVLHPLQLYGAKGGEVDNHFWMLWVGAQHVFGDAGVLGNAPLGWEIPMMDPINLIWSVPAGLVRPELGYTAVLWANLVLAGFGGGLLAVELAARGAGSARAAFWGGAVAAMASPPLLGFMDFGVTEAWTVGWIGLHAAALLRWGRTGSDRALVGGALAAAAVWASGWYNVIFLAILEPFLLVACGRWSWRPLAAMALAAVPRLPALWETHTEFALWASRMSGKCDPAFNRAWIARPYCGADLAAMLRPSPERLQVSHAMYVGWAIVALGIIGLFVGAVPRRAALSLLAAALVLSALALGEHVRFAGGLLLQVGPAGWVTSLLPVLRAITHWERAQVPAGMLLAGLAGAAVGHLGARGRAWAALAGGAMLVDALAFGGGGFPRQGYPTDLPGSLLALPGDGPLLLVPVDNTFDPPPGRRSRRPYNQWQVFFGRPVSENYEGPDEVSRSGAMKWLSHECGVRPAPQERLPRSWDLHDLANFGTDGFEWLVVVPELAVDPQGCVDAVTAALGAPTVSDRILAWPLQSTGVSAIGR